LRNWRYLLRVSPLWSFLRVRHVWPVAGITVMSWLYLALAGPFITVPFQQRSVPSPLIWPVLAALGSLLLSISQSRQWEAGSSRNLAPYRLASLLLLSALNLVVARLLLHDLALPSLLIWYMFMHAVALGGVPFVAERAWLPLAAIALISMYEMGQPDSVVVRVMQRPGPVAIVAAVLVYVIATVRVSTTQPPLQGDDQ